MSKILIVDDNAQNLYLARFLLEKNGHKIDEAHNGQEAIDFCKSKDVDLILMDVQMPVMDGLTATRIIKSEINPNAIIIALTAKAMEGDKEKILTAGCDGYIKKPLTPESFADSVIAHLSL